MKRAVLRQERTAGSPPLTASAADLADEFLDSYICWREECIAVEHAYEAWRNASPGDGMLAFAGYRAALDREEQAARALGKLTDRLRRPLQGGD